MAFIGGRLARNPTPASAHLRPAAVVEGREAPRLVVDPGPAPGVDVGPAAIAVGRPVLRNIAREPDLAVVGRLLEVAIGVEIFIPRLGHGNPRLAVEAALRLALPGPVVDRRVLGVLQVRVVARIDHRRRSGLDVHEAARPRRLSVAFDGGHFDRRIGAVLARRADVDAVRARAIDAHLACRRGDAHPAPRNPPEPQIHRSLRHGEAHLAIVEAHHVELGLLIQPRLHRAELQLGAAIVAGPERLARRDREVAHRLGPVVLLRRLESDPAFHIADAPDPGGRIGQGGCGEGAEGASGDEAEDQAVARHRALRHISGPTHGRDLMNPR